MLEVDLLRIGTVSLADTKYVYLVVEKASKVPLAFLIPRKKVERVARHLLQLCLTFDTPRVVQSGEGI